ncbi:hypothetical protein P171DRAFT_522435 [Karstenula rhodostoma CBS 690.94]|uniref:Uncharacterized protein n=1 Tax=Karstenula rhodostoma CBS 690.94 TaxID=1392251 RepID=A0A9P4PCW8_9PLEO|nr:hypothetical protein P171DRAFT_522435 [Karstenula rhodostoma CBS 690.94]
MSSYSRWTKPELLQHIDQLHGHAETRLTEVDDLSARVRALEFDNKNLRELLAQHGLTAPKPTTAATFAFSAPVANVNNTVNNLTIMNTNPASAVNNAAPSQPTSDNEAPQVPLPKWRTVCKRELLGRCRRNACDFAHQYQRAAYGETRINALPKYSAKSQKK